MNFLPVNVISVISLSILLQNAQPFCQFQHYIPVYIYPIEYNTQYSPKIEQNNYTNHLPLIFPKLVNRTKKPNYPSLSLPLPPHWVTERTPSIPHMFLIDPRNSRKGRKRTNCTKLSSDFTCTPWHSTHSTPPQNPQKCEKHYHILDKMSLFKNTMKKWDKNITSLEISGKPTTRMPLLHSA